MSLHCPYSTNFIRLLHIRLITTVMGSCCLYSTYGISLLHTKIVKAIMSLCCPSSTRKAVKIRN